MSSLVVEGNPTTEYLDMVDKQREWLYNNGTTIARAKKIIKVLNK